MLPQNILRDQKESINCEEITLKYCRSQWPRGLGRGTATARLLGLRVRIPPTACLSVSLASVMCFQVEVSGRADHPSRGILLTVECLGVIVKSR